MFVCFFKQKSVHENAPCNFGTYLASTAHYFKMNNLKSAPTALQVGNKSYIHILYVEITRGD